MRTAGDGIGVGDPVGDHQVPMMCTPCSIYLLDTYGTIEASAAVAFCHEVSFDHGSRWCVHGMSTCSATPSRVILSRWTLQASPRSAHQSADRPTIQIVGIASRCAIVRLFWPSRNTSQWTSGRRPLESAAGARGRSGGWREGLVTRSRLEPGRTTRWVYVVEQVAALHSRKSLGTRRTTARAMGEV